MHPSSAPLSNTAPIVVRSNGQVWHAAWHNTTHPPPGTNHGAAAICVVNDGRVVLVSRDGVLWGLPGGQPDPGETPEQALAREVLEEAEADVVTARLLGFTSGACVEGPQQGTVLVRSFWRATVTLRPWQPRFEMTHRQLVAPEEVEAILVRSHPDGSAPLLVHAYQEAMTPASS